MARTYGKAQDLIDFTRASSGTALRRVKYGAELVTNGTFDSDSDWAKGAGWSISGGELVATSVSAFVSAYQTVSLTAGKIYKVTYDITSFTAGAVRFKLTSGTEVSGANNASVGTFTDILIPNSGNDTLSIQAAGSGFTGTIDNISVKEVTFDTSDGDLVLFNHPDNIPRIEYDANGNLLGLLVEESRTNLVPYSDFSASWGIFNVDRSSCLLPDGNTGDNVFIPTTSNSQKYVSYAISVSSGVTYTKSVYAKDFGTGAVSIHLATSTYTSGSISFNFDTETLTESGDIISKGYQKLPNGWYRIWCTATTDAAGTDTFYIGIPNLISYSGNGTDGIALWNPQQEVGSFPTSAIPTSGSTATRSADVASLSTSAFGYRQDEGTVVVDYRYSALDNNQRAFELESDSANFMIHYQNAGNTRWYVATAGSSQANLIADSNSLTDVAYKFAGAYKANDFAVTQNGAAVVSDTSGAIPFVDTLRIGNSYAGANQLNGHIKSLKYIPRRLTNDQLVELTS